MKILLIHNYYRNWGGEDAYFNSLTNLLVKKGHTVQTYTKDNKDIKTIFQRICVALGMLWNPLVENELSIKIKKFAPDIVQFQNIYPLIGPTAYWVCNKNNIPAIQRISNYRSLCPKGTLFRNSAICQLCINRSYPYPSILHHCYHESRIGSFFLSNSLYLSRKFNASSLVKKFIFPSKFTREYFKKNLALPNNKLVVVPTFIENMSPQENIKKGDYFIYVGRLAEEKGILFLLDLFVELPGIKLIVVGNGPLASKISQYKKCKNIKFTGYLSKRYIRKYMQKAIATIIPSLCFDVLPQVLIESYREGTPVIAPCMGSFPSLVQQNITGFLYEERNRSQLRSYIQYSVRNKKKMYELGQSGNKLYKRTYHSSVHYQSLIKIYSDAINSRSKTRD
ncbi:MAG: glycosyltransferase family 4 protein [bacterium]